CNRRGRSCACPCWRTRILVVHQQGTHKRCPYAGSVGAHGYWWSTSRAPTRGAPTHTPMWVVRQQGRHGDLPLRALLYPKSERLRRQQSWAVFCLLTLESSGVFHILIDEGEE